MEKRLTRVENGKMLCGVCAGVGQYFNIDPTLVRLGFVIFAFPSVAMDAAKLLPPGAAQQSRI